MGCKVTINFWNVQIFRQEFYDFKAILSNMTNSLVSSLVSIYVIFNKWTQKKRATEVTRNWKELSPILGSCIYNTKG